MAFIEKKEEDTRNFGEPFSNEGKRKTGLSFGAESREEYKPKKTGYEAVFSSVNENVNALLRSVRILEERYSNLRKKTQITDQNMLSDVKKIATDIKIIGSDMSEIRKQLLDISEKIGLLFEQTKSSVKKEEFAILEKYLSMWEPMRYLTYNEAVRLIKDNADKINPPDSNVKGYAFKNDKVKQENKKRTKTK